MSKIDRALIIRRLKVESSMEYAKTCAESCEAQGLPYEFIDGIEFMTPDDAYKQVGVWLNHDKFRDLSPGHHNCHASHIKAWRRIIEIGKPCIILEHDAYVKGDVRNIDIPDMSIVTFGHRVMHPDNYNPISPLKKLVEIPRAAGVHACAMTEKTAQWLVDDAEKNGVVENVDYWLIMEKTSGLPLYVAEPPQVVCWPRATTREWVDENTEFKAQLAGTWNFNDSITPGWTAGVKNKPK